MANNIIRLKDGNGYKYPVTKSDAVFMSDGNTKLTKKIGDIDKEIIDARRDNFDNETYNSLSDRLDEMTDNIANKVGKADIVNDLTTGGISKVLSAEQGKVLNEKALKGEDFVNNGGKVNGDIEIIPEKKFKSKMSSGRDVNIAYMQNNGVITIGDEQNPLLLAGAERPSVWENGFATKLVCIKDFISSQSANGYTKLPNGIILQWGEYEFTASSTSESTNHTITFSTIFPINTLNIIPVSMCQDTTGSWSPKTCNSIIHEWSVNNFTIKLATTTGYRYLVRYLAIGY